MNCRQLTTKLCYTHFEAIHSSARGFVHSLDNIEQSTLYYTQLQATWGQSWLILFHKCSHMTSVKNDGPTIFKSLSQIFYLPVSESFQSADI